MSLTEQNVRQRYNGNGSTTTFAIPFEFYGDNTMVKVLVLETDGETETPKTGGGVDYSVVGTNVVFVSAPASGTKVLVYQDIDYDQDQDYNNQSTFLPSNLELGLDKLTSISQQTQEEVGRAIKFARSSNSSATMAEPTADTALVWDSTGTRIEPGPTVDAIEGAQAAALNAASSAASASDSASDAAASASAAAASAASAASDASSIAGDAAAAAASAAAALVSENNAATSETNAATSESNAATSESNAATSASSASTSATNASNSASAAATSETNAANSATAAATSATNAANSATAAAASAASIQGIPSGGTTNQVLAKIDATNYNVQWTDPLAVAAVGSSPNANGASVSGKTLTLQPADGTNPGALTASTQTIGGAKTFSSGVQGPNGSTATPSFYTPTGGGNTGFYFGVNGAAFGYNGTEVSSFINSIWKHNTQLQVAFAGSANSPALFLGTDSNSGFYRIGSNNLGFSISSAKVLDISSTGLGVTGTLSSSGTATLANVIDSGLTADTVPYANSSKQLTSSAVTPTELGYVSGVTSSIQTQITAKMTNPMTTSGDVIYGGASGVPTRLASGSNGDVLTLAAGIPSWAAPSGGSITILGYVRYTDFSLSSGWGSTDTSVFKASGSIVLQASSGTGVTYASNSTNGITLTVNHAGAKMAFVSMWAGRASNDNIGVGISLNANSTTRTTNVDSFSTTTAPYVVATGTASGSAARGTIIPCSWSGPVANGDVIRFHGINGVTYDKIGFSMVVI